jgi:hypothetical protein
MHVGDSQHINKCLKHDKISGPLQVLTELDDMSLISNVYINQSINLRHINCPDVT